MADLHGSPGDAPQMPAAGSGPAPVPYAGPDQSPEPPPYSAAATGFGTPGAGFLGGVTGTMGVQEAGYAHDLNAGLVTPHYAGGISPIVVGGDNDAGGRDDVSATVAGAVHAAEARYLEYEADTHAQGSTIGDLYTLPVVPEDANVPSADFLFAEGDQPGKGT